MRPLPEPDPNTKEHLQSQPTLLEGKVHLTEGAGFLLPEYPSGKLSWEEKLKKSKNIVHRRNNNKYLQG